MVYKRSSKKIIRRKSSKKSFKKGGASKRRSNKKNSKRRSRKVKRGGANSSNTLIERKNHVIRFEEFDRFFLLKQVFDAEHPNMKLFELAFTQSRQMGKGDVKFMDQFVRDGLYEGYTNDSKGVNRLYFIKSCLFTDIKILAPEEKDDGMLKVVFGYLKKEGDSLRTVFDDMHCAKRLLKSDNIKKIFNYMDKDLTEEEKEKINLAKTFSEGYKKQERSDEFKNNRKGNKNKMVEDVDVKIVGKRFGFKTKSYAKCKKFGCCAVGFNKPGFIYTCTGVCETADANKEDNQFKIHEDKTAKKVAEKYKFIIKIIVDKTTKYLEILPCNTLSSEKRDEKMQEIEKALNILEQEGKLKFI